MLRYSNTLLHVMVRGLSFPNFSFNHVMMSSMTFFLCVISSDCALFDNDVLLAMHLLYGLSVKPHFWSVSDKTFSFGMGNFVQLFHSILFQCVYSGNSVYPVQFWMVLGL